MSGASITTILRYEKPRAAAEWLRDAFGFEVRHIEEDGDGGVGYIALGFGDSGILVCPTDSPLLEELVVQPSEVGNRSTQICYLTVANVAGHCAVARKHGARIEREPLGDDAGREFYVCRDHEGHLWSFGNREYTQPAPSKAPAPPSQPQRRPSHIPRAASLLTTVVLAAMVGGGGVLFLVKQGREGLPNWLNTFVVDDQPAATNSPTVQTTAPATTTTKSNIATASTKKDRESHASLRERLRAQQDALAQAQARATRLAQTVASLTKRSADRAAETNRAYARLERLYRGAQTNSTAAKRALAAAQSALTRSKQTRAAFETRNARLIEQLSAATETLKTVRAEKDKALAELTRVMAETKAERNALTQKRAEHDVAERVAAKERAQFKATIEALNIRLQRVLATLVKVRREKQDVDQALGTTKQQAERKLAEKQKRLVALATAYERVDDALKNERLTLDQIVRAFNATKEQLARVQSAEKKLAEELNKTKVQLRNSRNDLKVKVAILQWLDLEAEVQRAQRDLQRKRREPPPPLPDRKSREKPAPIAAAPPPRPPAVAKPPANATASTSLTCARTARRRLSNFLGWRSTNTTSAVEYLCRGAETSTEPVECFRKVIWGRAAWGRGGNRPWSVKDALNLCSGTLSARHTLLCLRRQLRSNAHWRTAIEQCMTNW